VIIESVSIDHNIGKNDEFPTELVVFLSHVIDIQQKKSKRITHKTIFIHSFLLSLRDIANICK
jgi:hypothetical protein